MAPQNFDAKYDETVRLVKTSPDNGPTETNMADYMRDGDWQRMSAQEIAREWDDLSRDADEARKNQ